MALTRLYVADHPAAVWAEVVEPWLRTRGTQWRERRAILVPNAAWAAALKGQAVEQRLPAIGVKWLTPGRFRVQALAAHGGTPLRVPLREDLHLLLELAAAKLPENLLARAYGAEPAAFQALLDTLDGAGWGPEVLESAEARELAAAAENLRQRADWTTAAAADRTLRELTAQGGGPKMGEHLLVAGFGPGDWGTRSLLEAAMVLYDTVEMVLEVVDHGQPAAAAWVGTWEEAGGPAEWIEAPAGTAGKFAGVGALLASKDLAANAASTEPKPEIFLADDLQAEADLVVTKALAFLGDEGCAPSGRVGMVVGPVNSPLAREVAARLAALKLPHHDAPGHQPGRTKAQARFEAWLDWQEGGRLADLVKWVRAAVRLGTLPEREGDEAERQLREAADGTLSDDPAVLEAWLAAKTEETAAARKFLEEWPRLPTFAPWETLQAEAQRAAQKLGWPEEPETLAERAETWAGALTEPVPRAAALRWVRAVTRVPGRTRDECGREPFAPLQMVEAASAAAQPWTHLILGGLLHGEWPASEEDSPLLDAAQVAALNRKVLRQGPQGEGHKTVAPGHGLLLTAADRSRLTRAAFARLVALPTKGLVLTARRVDAADGRAARTSEFFWTTGAYILGRLPKENDWDALTMRSRACREAGRKIWAQAAKPEDGEIRATATAYAARRDAAQPFDEFSFCLKARPPGGLRLSCKAWEEALARPGAAWFKHLLRMEPRWDPATDDATGRVIGTWAHAWVWPGVAAGGEASEPLPKAALWEKIWKDRAEETRAVAEQAFAAAGRRMPEAWLDAWASAGRAAGAWARVLGERSGWPEGRAEIKLANGLSETLPHTQEAMALVGRMDLVLLSQPGVFAPGGLAGKAAWLIDFKTGGDELLSLSRLKKREGVQIALYALALKAMGAGPVAMTLLTRDSDAEPQLTGEDLALPELAEVWRLVAAMAATGCWGEFHDLANPHDRPGDYPLAALPVPAEILRKKWALTHPPPP
jgi:hypothetical protein